MLQRGKYSCSRGSDLYGIGEMGGESQFLAGGTLPPSWHLLLFHVKQVPLALCCLTGWEASPMVGTP